MCTKISTRCLSFLFAMVMLFALIGMSSSITSHADTVDPNDATYLYSCWGLSKANLTVYDYNKNSIGAIYAGEGFTVIGTDLIGNHETGYMINYSTSSGAKTGYLTYTAVANYCILDTAHTCAGTVSSSTTVYYGKNTDQYQVVGSVSTGEIVSVLAQSSGKCCIEYNTTSGRKRGWCPSSSITQHPSDLSSCSLGSLPCNASFANAYGTYSYRTVYAGPGNQYYHVGSIGTSTSSETVYITAYYTYNGQNWAYITYSTSGKDKSGYIKI